jgi:hypothetical protein
VPTTPGGGAPDAPGGDGSTGAGGGPGGGAGPGASPGIGAQGEFDNNGAGPGGDEPTGISREFGALAGDLPFTGMLLWALVLAGLLALATGTTGRWVSAAR